MVAKLLYDGTEIGHVMTNHSMSIEDVLKQLDINMDDYAREHGWDGWDYEALSLDFGDDTDGGQSRAKVDINAYGYQEGKNPDLTYGWIISTDDSAHGPGIITRRVWVDLPDGVTLAEPDYGDQAKHMLQVCRKGYNCHDGHGDTCQINIDGDIATNPGYVGVKLPGNNVDEAKAKIDDLIKVGLTISMPTNRYGKRETVPVKIVKDDGYVNG